MLALAGSGAGVLMPHSVETARDHGVSVHVRSSFNEEVGTWVRPEAGARPFVGITGRVADDQGVITVVGSNAHLVANDEMVAMHDEGIISAMVSADDQSVSLHVAKEQIDQAVRFLHTRLFQMEASK
jgi:aspartokinase